MSGIHYEKGIHQSWMAAVEKSMPKSKDSVIRQIKEHLKQGALTEAQLIEWGQLYRNNPQALVDVLLHHGLDLD